MEIAVSELIVRFMARLGIEVAFGVPGAHILPVYDRLRESPIRTVLVKHEQGAAFMACGYTRASGKIAACITTAGPGATNLVTGVANAYADKQPLLIVTGETSTHIFGKGGLQESSGEGGAIDQAALFRGITRYSKTIERTDYLGHVLNQAARILRSNNSAGPVLLSFPFNVQQELVDENVLDTIAAVTPLVRAPKLAIGELTNLIQEAACPVFVAGYGCIQSGAQTELAELSAKMRIPVATSLKGKGVIDEQSPLALGCLGVTSAGKAYRYMVDRADLVVFLGAGFNERTSYLWDPTLLSGKKVAQVDNDPGQLEKVFVADVVVQGDIKQVLSSVSTRLGEHGAMAKMAPFMDGERNGGCLEAVNPVERDTPDFLLMERFFRRLSCLDDVVIFDDNMIFAQNFLSASPNISYFPNSGISSLGHAIPAALGARCAVARPTFAILGDAGFQMCCMEIMTAVNYRLPMNVVVLNNGSLGLIRKNQVQLYGSRFVDCDFVNPDFSLLARAFGITHRRVVTGNDVDALFTECDFVSEINLIEIVLDKDVFPNYVSGR